MERPIPFAIVAALCGIGASALVLTALPPELRLPATQAAMALGILAAYLAVRRIRGGRGVDLFDVGTLFTAIVFLYTFIPLVSFVIQGGAFSSEGDSRLYYLRPGPDLVTDVGWHYVAFMAAFAVGYSALWRRRDRAAVERPGQPMRGFLFWMVGIYIGLQLVFAVVEARYGLYAETYLESYGMFRDVPVFLQQTVGWLTAFRRIVEIGLLAYFFARYDRFRVVVWAWLAILGVATFMRLHARTDLMIAAGCSVFLYHVFVRRIGLVRLAIVSGIVVLAFQTLGVLRGLGGYVDDLATSDLVSRGSEFESVFANAIHIMNARQSGQVLPSLSTWYLSEIAIIIPQQLLPFDKINPSLWYVRTFFPGYESLGGGYAFGSITQSVAGFGIVEAVIRGGLLGLVFAAGSWFLRRRWSRFEAVVVYAWLMGTAYLSMRNMTFFFVHGAVYCVLPWLFACRMIRGRIVRGRPVAPSVGADVELGTDQS